MEATYRGIGVAPFVAHVSGRDDALGTDVWVEWIDGIVEATRFDPEVQDAAEAGAASAIDTGPVSMWRGDSQTRDILVREFVTYARDVFPQGVAHFREVSAQAWSEVRRDTAPSQLRVLFVDYVALLVHRRSDTDIVVGVASDTTGADVSRELLPVLRAR